MRGHGLQPLNEAIDRLARARIYAEHGDATRAEHYARLVLDVSRERGYPGHERRAQELLDALAGTAR